MTGIAHPYGGHVWPPTRPQRSPMTAHGRSPMAASAGGHRWPPSSSYEEGEDSALRRERADPSQRQQQTTAGTPGMMARHLGHDGERLDQQGQQGQQGAVDVDVDVDECGVSENQTVDYRRTMIRPYATLWSILVDGQAVGQIQASRCCAVPARLIPVQMVRQIETHSSPAFTHAPAGRRSSPDARVPRRFRYPAGILTTRCMNPVALAVHPEHGPNDLPSPIRQDTYRPLRARGMEGCSPFDQPQKRALGKPLKVEPGASVLGSAGGPNSMSRPSPHGGFDAPASGSPMLFTMSERVAIGEALEAEIGNRQGERTDTLPANVPGVPKGVETRDVAAKASGFTSTTTYRQAKTLVAEAPDLAEVIA